MSIRYYGEQPQIQISIDGVITFPGKSSSFIYGDFYTMYQSISPGSVDLLTVDPNWGVLKKHDWDIPHDWEKTEKVFAKLLSPKGQAIIFCNMKLLLEIMNTFGEYLEYRHELVWHKSSALPSSKLSPIPNGEFILVFKKKGAKTGDLVFNADKSLFNGKPYIKRNYSKDVSIRDELKPEIDVNESGSRRIRRVIYAPSKPNMEKWERTSHPAQKPLILIRELIRVYSNPKQLIVSPFVGSGTDINAAFIEGRRVIGFEKESKFFNEAMARIEKYFDDQDLFRELNRSISVNLFPTGKNKS